MKRKICLLIMFLLINLSVFAEGEATLKNIRVNGRECSCNGYDCSIEVDAKSATVTYELVDNDAKVDRLSGFNVELNSINTLTKIVVTNDKGDEKIENTYNINITLHEKSGDFSIKSLKVDGHDIELVDEVYVYSYDVDYKDEKIVVNAETTDPNAKIKIEEEYEFPLDRSSTTADFEVTAENGDTRSYRIVIKRKAMPDTTLKSLSIDKGNIDFKSDVFEYKMLVEYSVNKLEIEAVPTNKNAKVKIEQEDLVVGLNTIKIIVTNDQASSEYTLLVTREENIDKSLANLKSLSVKEYAKLDFDENVLDYTLKFSEIPKSLTIDAKAVSKDTKVEILNNKDLKDNSKVVVKVSLNDSTISREYTLKLVKNEHSSSNKTFVVISIIILVITIIILLILEMKERKVLRKKKLTKIIELKKKKDKETKIKKEKVVKKQEKIEDDDIEII